MEIRFFSGAVWQWRTQLKNGGRANFDHNILDKEQQHDYQEQSGRTTNKNQNVIF
jgi:hypothetical protein